MFRVLRILAGVVVFAVTATPASATSNLLKSRADAATSSIANLR
jgi:hypothetical protein